MDHVADLLMPKLGLTMTEGTVARWMAAPGQRFAAGDIIVVVETDKIANDVEAPTAGEMVKLLSAEGEVVPVGQPIAQWKLDDAAPSARPAPASAPRAQESAVSRPRGDTPKLSPKPTDRIIATPYARRLAREASLDLAGIAGSGPRGRIKSADVLRAKEEQRPSRQIATTVTTIQRAAPAGASATAHSFATVDVDVSALRVLDARLAATRDRPFERRVYIALACIKALGDDAATPVRLSFSIGGVFATLEGTARDTLSAITARLAQASGDATGGDIAIVVIDGRARQVVPTIPTGWRMALGVGGVRASRTGDTTHEMTLALAYDTADVDHTSAAQLLDRMAALLEEPLHLLAV
jgi:pyruvate dehydrogenase E2 component (dihydrolipoamide acetyltransferase)